MLDNARILTLDAAQLEADAMLVAEGRVRSVGTLADARAVGGRAVDALADDAPLLGILRENWVRVLGATWRSGPRLTRA